LAFPLGFPPIRLIILLDHGHHFPGFVCEKARLCPNKGTIAIRVRSRRGSSRCARTAIGPPPAAITSAFAASNPAREKGVINRLLPRAPSRPCVCRRLQTAIFV